MSFSSDVTRQDKIQEYDKEIGNKKGDISELKKKIEEIKRAEEELNKEKSRINKEMQKTEKEIEKARDRITLLKIEEREISRKVEDVASVLEMMSGEVESYAQKLLVGLQSFYKNVYCQYVRSDWAIRCLGKGGMGCLIQMNRYSGIVLEKGLGVYHNLLGEEAEMQNRKDLLEIKLDKNTESIRIVSTTKKKEEERKRQQKKLAESIEQERKRYLQEIDELKKTEEALKNLIKTFEGRKSSLEKEESNIVRKEKNFLPWPAEGKLIKEFGKQKHPHLDTYVINQGIEIMPESDLSVVSVASGRVVYADSFKSYGKMVIVDHGGSLYTVYGHLSGFLVKQGTRVVRGTRIASLRKGDSLYFEVRDGGKSVDPLLWLKKK